MVISSFDHSAEVVVKAEATGEWLFVQVSLAYLHWLLLALRSLFTEAGCTSEDGLTRLSNLSSLGIFWISWKFRD